MRLMKRMDCIMLFMSKDSFLQLTQLCLGMMKRMEQRIIVCMSKKV